MPLKLSIPGPKASRQRVQRLFIPARKFKCVDCDKQAQEYDHYLGYGRNWNKVQPVCHSCHMKREYKRGSKHSTAWRPRVCPHGVLGIRNCKKCRNALNLRSWHKNKTKWLRQD